MSYGGNQGYNDQVYGANQGYNDQVYGANQGYNDQVYGANQGYGDQVYGANQGYGDQGYGGPGYGQQQTGNNFDLSLADFNENMSAEEIASRMLGSSSNGELANLQVPEVSQRDLQGFDVADLERSAGAFGVDGGVTERGLFGFNGGHGKSKTSHQLIGGAAAWAALNWYQNKSRNEGKKVSHSFLKKLMVAFAAAQAVKYCEKNSSSFQTGISRDLAIQEATRSAAAAADMRFYKPTEYQYNEFKNGESTSYDNFQAAPANNHGGFNQYQGQGGFDNQYQGGFNNNYGGGY